MPLTELPPKVKSILPSSLTERWLNAFNAALDEGRSDCYAHAWGVALGDGDIVMNDNAYSFAIDLGKYEFSEGDSVVWLQAMPLGNWTHPTHGPINVTPERVQEFANNVQANVRGQDLDIDYDHKEYSGEAAGWVKGAQARADGLWLGVQLTASALQKVKEKAYRYFSPEFTDKWKHPSTGTVHKNVLFGGALTNRPFLKGILPINLSEVMTHESGEVMDLEKLRKLLGLPDTATEAEVLAAVEANKVKADSAPDPKGSETDPPEPKKEGETEPKKEGETDPPEPKETEAVAASEEVKKLREEIDLLKAANRVSDVTVKLSEVQSGKDVKFALAPATQEKLKSLALDAPTGAYSEKLFAFVEECLGSGVIELGERVKSKRRANDEGKSASETFLRLAEDYSKEHKVALRDALEAVGRDDPELYSEYRNESYTRTRGEDS